MKISDIHSEIQTGIINYLSVHPGASASVKRICNQWLGNERYSHSIDQVQTAVDNLVVSGELHQNAETNVYTL